MQINYELEVLNLQFIIKPINYEEFDKTYQPVLWPKGSALSPVAQSLASTIYYIVLTVLNVIGAFFSRSLQTTKIHSFTAVRHIERCIGYLTLLFFHKIGAFIIQDADYHLKAYQLQKQLFSSNGKEKEKALDQILIGSVPEIGWDPQDEDLILIRSRLKKLSAKEFKMYFPFFSTYPLVAIDGSLMKYIDMKSLTTNQKWHLFPSHCDKDKVKNRLQALDKQQLCALWEKIDSPIKFYSLLTDEQKTWVEDPGSPLFSDEELEELRNKFARKFAGAWLGGQANKQANVQDIQEAAQLLGVEIEASHEEINRQFKKKALACHPDKNQEDLEKAHDTFIKLCQAKDLLIKRN